MPRVDPTTAVVQEYRCLADWLELPPTGDAVRNDIGTLISAPDDQTRAAIESNIKRQISVRFGLM